MTGLVSKSYYGAYQSLWVPSLEESNTVSDEGMQSAVSCNAALVELGFTLTAEGIESLAKYYTSHSNADFNPVAELQELLPKHSGRPLISGFPDEVLAMGEAKYRFIQIMHYLSTYGIRDSGIEDVPVGWLPENTKEETKGQTFAKGSLTVLPLYFGYKEVVEKAKKDLASPVRMTEVQIRSVAEVLLGSGYSGSIDVAFKENATALVYLLIRDGIPSKELYAAASALLSNPMDVLKTVNYVADSLGKSLPTKYKKAFSWLFDGYSSSVLANNLADAKVSDAYAIQRISYKRFSNSKSNVEAVNQVRLGKIKSFNSNLDRLITGYSNGKNTLHDLLAFLEKRPGVYLRALRRVVRVVGVDKLTYSVKSGFKPTEYQVLEDSLTRVAGKMSRATLVRTITKFSKAPNYGDTLDTENVITLNLLCSALKSNLLGKKADRLAGKKVYLSEEGISKCGSVLLPSDNGQTDNSYPPNGMAYSLPEDGYLRFFMFWQDEIRMVDLDMHAFAVRRDGEVVHIGWNSDFRNAGIVMSGDVTSSRLPAEEYIDIDMAKASESNIAQITMELQAYAHCSLFSNIKTAKFGAEQISREDLGKKNVTTFDSKNLLFSDDLNASVYNLNMAEIIFNKDNASLRMIRNQKEAIGEFLFTLETYLGYLGEAWGITWVDDKEDADVVLTIGRSTNKEDICLIDENFFFTIK